MERIFHINHGKAVHPYVTDITVSRHRGFNAEATVRSVVTQIFQCNAVDAAGYFAADGNTEARLNLTVLHRNIMAGAVHTDAIRISSRLDTDAVVVAVCDAVLHQNIVAGININSISAGTFRPARCDLYAIHMNVVTVADMDIPEAGSR